MDDQQRARHRREKRYNMYVSLELVDSPKKGRKCWAMCCLPGGSNRYPTNPQCVVLVSHALPRALRKVTKSFLTRALCISLAQYIPRENILRDPSNKPSNHSLGIIWFLYLSAADRPNKVGQTAPPLSSGVYSHSAHLLPVR